MTWTIALGILLAIVLWHVLLELFGIVAGVIVFLFTRDRSTRREGPHPIRALGRAIVKWENGR